MPDQVNYTLRMQESGQYTYHAQSAVIDVNTYLWQRAPEDFCQGIYLSLYFIDQSIYFRSDRSVTANYTNQFLGVQYFIDLSIIQYATNITQDSSSVISYFFVIFQ